MKETRTIACNYVEATKLAARGAKAYLFNPPPGNGGEQIEIVLRSRSGRWIRKWERIRRLGNFRAVTVVDREQVWSHLFHHDPEAMIFYGCSTVEETAAALGGAADHFRAHPALDAETLQRVRRGAGPGEGGED